MTNNYFILLTLSLAAVMLLIRLLPVSLLSNLELPPFLKKWLSYIPPAILSALTLSELVVRSNKLDFSLSNTFLMASIPTFIIAYYTKSLFITLTSGIIIVAMLRYGLNYV